MAVAPVWVSTFPADAFAQEDDYIQKGRIQIEKDKFEGPITFHDPCNLGRREV